MKSWEVMRAWDEAPDGTRVTATNKVDPRRKSTITKGVRDPFWNWLDCDYAIEYPPAKRPRVAVDRFGTSGDAYISFEGSMVCKDREKMASFTRLGYLELSE